MNFFSQNEDNLYSFTDYYYYKFKGIEKINLKIYIILQSLSHEETTWKLLPENYISLDINFIVNFLIKFSMLIILVIFKN